MCFQRGEMNENILIFQKYLQIFQYLGVFPFKFRENQIILDYLKLFFSFLLIIGFSLLFSLYYLNIDEFIFTETLLKQILFSNATILLIVTYFLHLIFLIFNRVTINFAIQLIFNISNSIESSINYRLNIGKSWILYTILFLLFITCAPFNYMSGFWNRTYPFYSITLAFNNCIIVLLIELFFTYIFILIKNINTLLTQQINDINRLENLLNYFGNIITILKSIEQSFSLILLVLLGESFSLVTLNLFFTLRISFRGIEYFAATLWTAIFAFIAWHIAYTCQSVLYQVRFT